MSSVPPSNACLKSNDGEHVAPHLSFRIFQITLDLKRLSSLEANIRRWVKVPDSRIHRKSACRLQLSSLALATDLATTSSNLSREMLLFTDGPQDLKNRPLLMLLPSVAVASHCSLESQRDPPAAWTCSSPESAVLASGGFLLEQEPISVEFLSVRLHCCARSNLCKW